MRFFVLASFFASLFMCPSAQRPAIHLYILAPYVLIVLIEYRPAVVVTAIRLHKVIRGEALLILDRIISIAFGIFVFFFPDAGALALVWLISTYDTVSGLLFILAWRKKNGEPA